MKIISWNVNGIRAIERKGELQTLVEKHQPDCLLIQETKGSPEQFSKYLTEHPDYRQFYSSAVKKGYSGTGAWISRDLYEQLTDPLFVTDIPDLPNSDEGRISQLSFKYRKKRYDIQSIYFPNGGKSELAWKEKLLFYDRVLEQINRLRDEGHIVIVAGDMNVAHNEIDIARPKDNDGKIGFHPKERAWMDRVIEQGWIDVWRTKNPDVTDIYSWWHLVTRSRERNIGWRIDYFLIDQALVKNVEKIEYLNDQMGSDHCPVTMKFKIGSK